MPTSNLLYNLPRYKTDYDPPRLLRIILNEKFTRIDFGYQADSKYIRGGWVTISPKTFIRSKGSDEKLVLTLAVNIPYTPDKHHFKSIVDNLSFSLFFPPLPDGVSSFDLIEDVKGTPTSFNYHDIKLRPATAIRLR